MIEGDGAMIRLGVFRGLFFLLIATAPAIAADSSFDRKEDVIYSRKFGSALTLDVFTPKANANGLGLVYVVSGGWFSDHNFINTAFIEPFTARGYTVFAVVHGSQPRYTIPEVIADMRKSVRFIRTHAKEYHVDPEKLGVYGGSAGGHLSLMLGTSSDEGNAASKDPVEKASSRVAAVACFFPPTDFLNYGKEGEHALGRGVLINFQAPFDFQEMDPARNVFVPIVDEAERLKIGRAISPINHVTKDDAPTFVLHGDADFLVPIQQARRIGKKFKEVDVPFKLVVKPGAGHGWKDITQDLTQFADWFDQYLKPSKQAAK
jgi:acetyl esterase/lipase